MKTNIQHSLVAFTLIFCFFIGITKMMHPAATANSIKSKISPALYSLAGKNVNIFKGSTMPLKTPYFGNYSADFLNTFKTKPASQNVLFPKSSFQNYFPAHSLSAIKATPQKTPSLKSSFKNVFESTKSSFESSYPKTTRVLKSSAESTQKTAKSAYTALSRYATKRDLAYIAGTLGCAGIGTLLPSTSSSLELLTHNFLAASAITSTILGAKTLEKPKIDGTQEPAHKQASLVAYVMHYSPYIGLLLRNYYKQSPAKFKQFAIMYLATQAFAPLATKYTVSLIKGVGDYTANLDSEKLEESAACLSLPE